MRLTAPIVNALVDPVIQVLQRLGGLDAHLSSVELATDLPPAPCLSVTIVLRGALTGPVVWVFNQRMAAALAQHMIPGVTAPDLETCQDVVSELANVIAGNATVQAHQRQLTKQWNNARGGPSSSTARPLPMKR